MKGIQDESYNEDVCSFCVSQMVLPVDDSLTESVNIRAKSASLCKDTLLKAGECVPVCVSARFSIGKCVFK